MKRSRCSSLNNCSKHLTCAACKSCSSPLFPSWAELSCCTFSPHLHSSNRRYLIFIAERERPSRLLHSDKRLLFYTLSSTFPLSTHGVLGFWGFGVLGIVRAHWGVMELRWAFWSFNIGHVGAWWGLLGVMELRWACWSFKEPPVSASKSRNFHGHRPS